MPIRFNHSRFFPAARVLTFVGLTLVFAWDFASAQTSYYQGKTLHIIVAFGPGGVTDLSARLVARHLGKHIPGNPNIIVQNMSGAAGITGANHLYNLAKRDGLTIMAMGRANYLEQMTGKPEVRFDFRKFSWVGSFNNAPMMLACRADRGLTTPEKIRAVKAPPRIGQGGSGSISTIFSSLVEEALNLKFQNVMGYQSGREIDLALERGEIDCRASSDITILRSPWPEWLEKRFVTFLVQQGPQKSRVLPGEVPTVYDLAPAGAKPVLDLMSIMLAFTEFDRPFAAPPDLPAQLLQTLRDGFEKMLGDPGFSSDAKKLVDWDGSYLTGEQLQKRIETTVNQSPEVIKRIKQILQ
jgi:tripartite-type tricarboxylate transporter receptor subunit TctC